LNNPVLKRGEELTRSCTNKIKELEKRFVINLKDDPQKLRQFSYIIRTAGVLSRFDNKYKNAVKAYLMMLRPGNSKPKPSQMFSDFSTIADLLDDIRHLDDDNQLRNVVGPHYQGLYTDFSLLLRVNEYGASVCKDFNTNTKLGKCIRQFLLDEPVEILDSFKAMTDKLNIDEIIHYADGFASATSPKNMESICQEYVESTILIDSFYSCLSI
jgi:hypothetical protein